MKIESEKPNVYHFITPDGIVISLTMEQLKEGVRRGETLKETHNRLLDNPDD